MRKPLLMCLLLALVFSLVPPALSQSDSTNEMAGPPKVLEIIREEVKPGKTYAHTQHEARWSRAMVNAKYDQPLLAMSSTTGPNEAWFLIGFDSFASFEKQGDRMMKNPAWASVMETYTGPEADYLQDARTMVAEYRPELSHHAGVNIGEYRYFAVRTTRAKMGENMDELMKIVNGARDSAGMDAPNAVYQVTSGAPTGTYITFHPMKSLAEMDTPSPQAYSDALKEANFTAVAAKVIATTESRVYEFSPAMSNPSKEMVAANPTFWKPKAMKAEMPAAKKKAVPEPAKQ